MSSSTCSSSCSGIAALTLAPLSLAVPFAALSYCGVVLASRLILREHISARRWAATGGGRGRCRTRWPPRHDEAIRIPSARRPRGRAADPWPDRHADRDAIRRQRAQPRRLHRARRAARRTLRRRGRSSRDRLARLVRERRRRSRAPARRSRSSLRRRAFDGRGARAEARDRPAARSRRHRPLRHDVLPRRLGDAADRALRVPAAAGECAWASDASARRWKIRRTASRTNASAIASSARCCRATARPAVSPDFRGHRWRNSSACRCTCATASAACARRA